MSANTETPMTDAAFLSGERVNVSSTEELKYSIEGTVVRSNPNGRATVDEVSPGRYGGARVYVDGEVVDPKSPPRKLTEAMLEHGYAYIGWIVNGKIGDDRAAFEFRQLIPKDTQ